MSREKSIKYKYMVSHLFVDEVGYTKISSDPLSAQFSLGKVVERPNPKSIQPRFTSRWDTLYDYHSRWNPPAEKSMSVKETRVSSVS